MHLTLLIDPPQDGLTNMAVDEALLGMAAAGELGPVLRFYQWSPATLSLGYFQRYTERAAHPPSEHCAIVRRASGGGAILHDRELTYSLVLPAGHALTARAEPLYRAVHQALIDVLAERGFAARFWDDVSPANGSAGASPSPAAFACGDANRQSLTRIPTPAFLPGPSRSSASSAARRAIWSCARAVSFRLNDGLAQDPGQCPAAAAWGGPATWQPALGPLGVCPRIAGR